MAAAVNQTMAAIQKIRDDITDLQKDMAKVGTLVDRLDATIDTLTEFSSNINKLISIHETKIDFHDKQNVEFMQEIKKLGVDSTSQHTALNKRISTMEKWMWLILGGTSTIGFILGLILKFI
jgi:flagellin-like hook-associated protein FlgL